MKRRRENIVFFLASAAAISAAAVILLCLFVLIEGWPLFKKVGLPSFLFGTIWEPGKGEFGILPMLAGSVAVTLGALILAVPLAVGTALLLSEFAPKKFASFMRPAIELLAGIPSVVYGFFGLVFLVPHLRILFGGSGFSILAGSIILTVMILPTIASISEDAIRAVPKSYREGSLALGATSWETARNVVLPAARSGIITAIILGLGRALGETMAVLMVTGNVAVFPHSITSPVRTLTGNIALEMGYATGLHRSALFATGIVLFVVIIILTLIASWTRRRANDASL